MERRRRALGLKKPDLTPEKNNVKAAKRTSSVGEYPTKTSEDKTASKGRKSLQKSQPSGSVTPKQKTPISLKNATPLKPESPSTPLQSPGSQMMFPGTLASPEIEVSWDWSCSQVPNEMLPPKKTKLSRDVKAQPLPLPTINMCIRPRHPLQRQITEEENQERLEFYKKILSLKPPEGSPKYSNDLTNNNNVVEDETKSFSTPKRPTTRLSSASKKKQDDNSLFDDSANEFMFECSQAIEEKLKNGEIDMGPIVDIKISQTKRLHSPATDDINSHKKTCHGRVNLFPDSVKRDTQCVKDGGQNNQIDPNPKSGFCKTERIALHDNSHLSSTSHLYNNNSVPLQNTYSGRLQGRTNVTMNKPVPNSELTNNSRKPTSVNSVKSKENPCFLKPQTPNSNTRNHQNNNKERNSMTNCEKKMQRLNVDCAKQDTNSNTVDISYLLDDDFDMELSCLDVDSLCQNSQSQPKNHETNSRPRICTKQEIEAKRLAALQKLMMKRKR